jgi:uncharacterized membrane protein
LIPEFVYIKDIYPMHYRANTMFKLVYQSFIMLSLSSGYVLFRLLNNIKDFKFKTGFVIFSSLLVFQFDQMPV